MSPKPPAAVREAANNDIDGHVVLLVATVLLFAIVQQWMTFSDGQNLVIKYLLGLVLSQSFHFKVFLRLLTLTVIAFALPLVPKFNSWPSAMPFAHRMQLAFLEQHMGPDPSVAAAVFESGLEVPSFPKDYIADTVAERVMRDWLDTTPGVHSFYMEKGMGKTTIASHVLADIFNKTQTPMMFINREPEASLASQLARLWRKGTGFHASSQYGADHPEIYTFFPRVVEILRAHGHKRLLIVIDRIDDGPISDMDRRILVNLAQGAMRARDKGLKVSVLCLIREASTRSLFADMNGGEKVTSGPSATELPPRPEISDDKIAELVQKLHLNASETLAKVRSTGLPFLGVVKCIHEGLPESFFQRWYGAPKLLAKSAFTSYHVAVVMASDPATIIAVVDVGAKVKELLDTEKIKLNINGLQEAIIQKLKLKQGPHQLQVHPPTALPLASPLPTAYEPVTQMKDELGDEVPKEKPYVVVVS